MNSLTNHSSGQLAKAEAREFTVRFLCLGNELLADDSLGNAVAERIREFAAPDVEVISTPESGFHLLDYVLNIRCLVVVDTVVTGTSPPGTIYAFQDHELKAVQGGSPHYVGLHETLALARQLSLPVAEEVVFLAVGSSRPFDARRSYAFRGAGGHTTAHYLGPRYVARGTRRGERLAARKLINWP